VVSAHATGPMGLAAATSGPAEDGGFLWAIKIRSAHFLPACKRSVESMGEMLCPPNFPTLFLTRDYPASLPDGSGC
jgi:hypothetical protein